MFGDFNTGPNAPRKRSRVAQGIHIGKRGSIPNTHSMRIFGCSVRHSTFTRSVAMQTTPHPDRRVHNPNGAPALRPSCRARPPRIHPATWVWAAPRPSRNMGLCHPTAPRPDRRRAILQHRAQTVVDLFRSAKFDPRLDHPAALDLGRPVPDTTPKPLGGEPKQKKSARIATFLRLGIVMGSPDCGSRCKNAGNRPLGSLFPLWRNRKESLIAKSCKNGGIFVFR